MAESFEGYIPSTAEEVRITALMNVLYYAQTEDLPGLLTWCQLLVRSGELSPEAPEKVEQAIAEVVALSMAEETPDREQLEKAFASACRMLGVKTS